MSSGSAQIGSDGESSSEEHRCIWRTEAEGLRTRVGDLEVKATQVDELEGKLAALTAAMEALTRRVLGPKSEKMPPPEQVLIAA